MIQVHTSLATYSMNNWITESLVSLNYSIKLVNGLNGTNSLESDGTKFINKLDPLNILNFFDIDKYQKFERAVLSFC